MSAIASKHLNFVKTISFARPSKCLPIRQNEEEEKASNLRNLKWRFVKIKTGYAMFVVTFLFCWTRLTAQISLNVQGCIVGCRGASQLGGLFRGNPPRV